MIGFEDVGEAAIDVALTQAMAADLVCAAIVDPAKVGELTPLEMSSAHLEARRLGTAGIRPIDQLMADVIAQIEAAIERRRKDKKDKAA
jgi:hypothetical protein